MDLCHQGQVVKSYAVALGRKGVDKRAHGDAKTPLGHYALGSPQLSERFHRFIPIAYPTPEQKKRGYSGGDVGLHGPTRFFKWAGWLNTSFGWTEGCVAVGSDQEIDEIADWTRKHAVRSVTLQ